MISRPPVRAKQQIEAAIEEYHKAIDLDPKHGGYHGMLGQALLDLGRIAEARDAARRSLELLRSDDPFRPSAT